MRETSGRNREALDVEMSLLQSSEYEDLGQFQDLQGPRIRDEPDDRSSVIDQLRHRAKEVLSVSWMRKDLHLVEPERRANGAPAAHPAPVAAAHRTLAASETKGFKKLKALAYARLRDERSSDSDQLRPRMEAVLSANIQSAVSKDLHLEVESERRGAGGPALVGPALVTSQVSDLHSSQIVQFTSRCAHLLVVCLALAQSCTALQPGNLTCEKLRDQFQIETKVSWGSATDDVKEKWKDMMCDLHFVLQSARNWLWLDFLKLASVLLVQMKTWANHYYGIYCGPPWVEEYEWHARFDRVLFASCWFMSFTLARWHARFRAAGGNVWYMNAQTQSSNWYWALVGVEPMIFILVAFEARNAGDRIRALRRRRGMAKTLFNAGLRMAKKGQICEGCNTHIKLGTVSPEKCAGSGLCMLNSEQPQKLDFFRPCVWRGNELCCTYFQACCVVCGAQCLLFVLFPVSALSYKVHRNDTPTGSMDHRMDWGDAMEELSTAVDTRVLTIIFFFAPLPVLVFYFLACGQKEGPPSRCCNCLRTCDQMTAQDYTTNACTPCMKRCRWCEEWEEPPVEVLLAAAEWEEARSKLREELDTASKAEDFIHASHLKGQLKFFGEIVDAIRSEDFARASMLKAKCDRDPSKPLPEIPDLAQLVAVLGDGSSSGQENLALALLMSRKSGGRSLEVMQEIASRFGDGRTQDIGNEDPAFDKFAFVRNKGGCKFEFTVNRAWEGPARSWPMLKIAGAQGLLNGVYVLTNDVYNDKPLFRKDGDADTWLRFTKDANWCFSDTKNKDANDNSYNYKSNCVSAKKGIDNPALVDSWKVRREDGDLLQRSTQWKVLASMKCTLMEVGFVHGEQKLTSVKPYFEVTILEDSVDGVGIGLSCDSFFAGSMVGWGSGSIGYHSHDGEIHYQGTSTFKVKVDYQRTSNDPRHHACEALLRAGRTSACEVGGEGVDYRDVEAADYLFVSKSHPVIQVLRKNRDIFNADVEQLKTLQLSKESGDVKGEWYKISRSVFNALCENVTAETQLKLAIKGVGVVPFGPISKAGDTIGCGILFDSSDQPATIFFIRNNSLVGRVPFPSEHSGMLFPVVSSASPAVVHVNLTPADTVSQLHRKLGNEGELRKAERIEKLRQKKEIIVRSSIKVRLPAWLSSLAHLEILRVKYPRLCTLKDVPFERLTKLRILDLTGSSSLTELPAELRSLTELTHIYLGGCDALHTPPKHVVEKGTEAILEFLSDLSKGDASCYLIKLVLLGDQRAGKSSLLDSLMLGRPTTRADSDRTVGIDVRRWPVGGESQLVINVFDAAGQRVYRATHGLFMSEGALFLHVVRSDLTESTAVATLLEWVEMVQQVAPGAIMAVVWTHIDRASDTALHSKVLTRVHEKVKRQVQDVHEALGKIEDEIEVEFEAQQQLDLKRNWKNMCTQRNDALSKLDEFAMAGCTAEDEEFREIQIESDKEDMIQRMVEALVSIQVRHNEMQRMERDLLSISQRVVDAQSFEAQLQRLRQWRVQRPRILCSRSVSSFTGEGLPELRCALTALMEDGRLFPHVGARVPLNYLMLERLAQQGRSQTGGGADHGGSGYSADSCTATISSVPKTSQWEMAITEHVAEQERKSPGLRKVCGNPRVPLDELEDAAQQVGMDRKEVMRALQFLHKTGSVLHYASIEVDKKTPDTHRGSPTLQNTVFMNPDFIIDAIKCVIRESSAKDVNDEVRKKDARIRRRKEDDAEREALNRFLGWAEPGSKWEMVGSEKPETGTEIQNEELSVALQQGKFEFRKEEIDAFKAPDLSHDSYIKVGTPTLGTTYFKTSDAGQHGSGVLTKRLLTHHLWRDFDPCYHEVLLELMQAFKLLRPLADTETYLVPAMLPRKELPNEYITPEWWCPSKASAAAIVPATQRPAVMRVVYQVLGGSIPFGFMSELQVLLSALQHTVSADQGIYFAPETAVVDRIFGSVLSDAYKCGGGVITEWVILSRPHIVDVHASGSMLADCIRIVGWVETSSGEGGSDWRLFRRVMQEIELMERRALGLCFQKKVFLVDARGKLGQIDHKWAQLETRVETLRFEFENGSTADVDREHVLPSGSEIKVVKPEKACAWDGKISRVDAFFVKQTDDKDIDVHAEGQMMTRIVMDAGGWHCNINPQPTIEDLYRSIQSAWQTNLQVLHLAGHGKTKCGFIWNANDAATASMTFDVDAISLAIGSVAGQQGPIECVVLNACLTERMGRLLRQRGVPYVLCWKTTVQDETAREFHERFYRSLVGSGSRDYKRAFLAATDAMQFSAPTRGGTPRGGSSRIKGKLQPRQLEDVLLFLSQDGDIGPVYLWREKPIVAASSDPAGSRQAVAVEETVDAEVKALFENEKYKLGAVCADVCQGLRVKCLDDLKLITSNEVKDELPKYVKEKLTLTDQRKLVAMIAELSALFHQMESETLSAEI